MQRRIFSREYKLEAVKLVRERGVTIAQAARDLDVHENVLRKWIREYRDDPSQSFPGKGQMKPEQLEIERLRREVAKLKAERDILKRPQPTLPGTRYEVRVHCKAPFDLAPFVVAVQRLSSNGWHGSAKRWGFLVQVSMPGSIVLRANTPAMMRFCWTRSRRASNPGPHLWCSPRMARRVGRRAILWSPSY